MPTVTLTWDDINDNEDGFNIYRDTVPLDTANPANLPAPLATVAAGIGTYDDTTAAADTTYYYAVAATKGTFVNAAAGVQVSTAVATGPDFSTAQIGDAIGGGIYAGIDTIGGADFHIISGDAASEGYGLQWKTSRTTTSGTGSDTDGLANTDAMVAAGIADHPAAQHCVNYAGGGHTDWHMPARSQITLMYNNLAGHTEFAANASSGDYTWASTEDSSFYAWARKFSDGTEYSSYATKDRTNLRVRPVRRVPV